MLTSAVLATGAGAVGEREAMGSEAPALYVPNFVQ